MKIIFESIDEIKDFMKEFSIVAEQKPVDTKWVEELNNSRKQKTKKEETAAAPEEEKEEVIAAAPEEEKKEPIIVKVSETKKISLEFLRKKMTELIKAGKQKEAKEIVKKFGASKLPEVSAEHYEDILKEIEVLL